MSSKDLHDAIKREDWNTARELLGTSNSRYLVEYIHPDLHNNALHACLWNGNGLSNVPSDLIQAMINASETAPLQQDKYGHTPLHLAIKCSSEDIMLILIEACPRAALIANHNGKTPLHEALSETQYRSSNIIGRLLAANPAATTATDRYGDTPLRIFFRRWNVPLRNSLESIDGDKNIQNVNLENHFTETKMRIGELYQTFVPLLQAATHGSMEVDHELPFRPLHAAINDPHCPWSFVSLILRMDLKEASLWDREGNLPVHVATAATSSCDGELHTCDECRCKLQNASWYERGEYYWIVCQNCFQDLDEEEKEDSKLMNSVKKIPAVIRYLLATYSDYAEIPNREGRLPFHIAVENKKSFKQNFETIFPAAPEALFTKDIKTHLYPFMLGAVTNSEQPEKNKRKPSEEFLQKFTSCYALLMENPVLVQSGILVRGSKRSRDGDIQG